MIIEEVELMPGDPWWARNLNPGLVVALGPGVIGWSKMCANESSLRRTTRKWGRQPGNHSRRALAMAKSRNVEGISGRKTGVSAQYLVNCVQPPFILSSLLHVPYSIFIHIVP